jgi:hypothetical protein
MNVCFCCSLRLSLIITLIRLLHCAPLIERDLLIVLDLINYIEQALIVLFMRELTGPEQRLPQVVSVSDCQSILGVR